MNLTYDDFLNQHNLTSEDISIDKYKEIVAIEKRLALEERARKASGSLQGSSFEESNARCNICASGLSIIETLVYGNRCIFCAEGGVVSIDLWVYLRHCLLDYRINKIAYQLIKKLGYDDARLLYTGCLAELGYGDINQARSIKDKRYLFRRLRDYANTKN